MNLQDAIVQVVVERGRDEIAEAVGKDPTFVSRFCSNERGVLLADLQSLLEACGLRVVKADAVLVDPAELRALRVLAKSHIERSDQ